MKKPIIGITLDNEEKGDYSKFPWYAIRNNYLNAVELFGGIPFLLSHSQKNINEIFNIIDGLIITGGNFDIDPNLYGEKESGSRVLKNNRTEFELKICKMALNSTKPILGVCGGAQLLNILCEGTLIQDIDNYKSNTLEHEQLNSRDETSHTVNILKDTKIYKIIKKEIIQVNSAHHQAINIVGKNIIKSGYATDGIVESIEHQSHKWCIGVQWHPEFLITEEDKHLFNDFVTKAINL